MRAHLRSAPLCVMPRAMNRPNVPFALDDEQQAARSWFESLRDRICAEFEAIEREAGSDAAFEYTAWNRDDDPAAQGGGGVRGVMKGHVFEKVGVNVSTVGGAFSEDFAKSIHGAGDNPNFFATGISLVAHMANPHVPAVHMNTRFLVTQKRWFGGGADLNPPLPYAEDTEAFHARLKQACDAHGADYYDRFKKWADDYFYSPHREETRGIGGIFFDYVKGDKETVFEFVKAVGESFEPIYSHLMRLNASREYTQAEKEFQYIRRGRYVEFNLVHDRGTKFGLETNGRTESILMSLPPMAAWEYMYDSKVFPEGQKTFDLLKKGINWI